MFFLEHWKSVVSVLVVAVLCGYIAVLTIERDDARRSLKDAKAQIDMIHAESEQVKADAIRRNAEIAAHDKQVNEDLAHDYAQTIASIKSHSSGITCRLRDSAGSGSGPVPQSGTPSSRIDAAASDAVAATNLPRDCAVTTEIALGLQKYVREECVNER